MHCRWGRKPPELSFHLGFHHLPEEDRATSTGNMHIKIGKDRMFVSGDILADRQMCSSQYFGTAPVGEVITHYRTKMSCCQVENRIALWSEIRVGAT